LRPNYKARLSQRSAKMCGLKRTFGDEDAIREFLRERQLADKMHHYNCPHCRHWHVARNKGTAWKGAQIPNWAKEAAGE
jgi:ribosomal protein L37AE/L43A